MTTENLLLLEIEREGVVHISKDDSEDRRNARQNLREDSLIIEIRKFQYKLSEEGKLVVSSLKN